jgi:hypothetical protein
MKMSKNVRGGYYRYLECVLMLWDGSTKISQNRVFSNLMGLPEHENV